MLLWAGEPLLQPPRPAGSLETGSLAQTWRRLAWENPGLDTYIAQAAPS